MMERQWTQCAYCADPFDDEERKPIWEHVIPLDRGGCDHLANLVGGMSGLQSRSYRSERARHPDAA